MLFNVPSALVSPRQTHTRKEGNCCCHYEPWLVQTAFAAHFSHLWGRGLMVTVWECLGQRAVASNYWHTCVWTHVCVFMNRMSWNNLQVCMPHATWVALEKAKRQRQTNKANTKNRESSWNEVIRMDPNPTGSVSSPQWEIWTQTCTQGKHYVTMKAEIKVILLELRHAKDCQQSSRS